MRSEIGVFDGRKSIEVSLRGHKQLCTDVVLETAEFWGLGLGLEGSLSAVFESDR